MNTLPTLPLSEAVYRSDRPLHHTIMMGMYLDTFDRKNLTPKYKRDQARLLNDVFKHIELADPNHPTIKRPIDTFDLCNPSLKSQLISSLHHHLADKPSRLDKIYRAIRKYAHFVKETHTIHHTGQKPLYLPDLYGPLDIPISGYDIPRQSSDRGPNHRYFTQNEYKWWLQYTFAQINPDVPVTQQHKAYTFHVMCVLAGETGMRLIEIHGIKPQDIHWDDNALLVTQGKGTRGSGPRKRMVALSTFAQHTVKEYIQHYQRKTDEWVFQSKAGETLSLNTTHNWMRQAKKEVQHKKLNIYLPARFGWHAFRRTYTKTALQNGIGIEALKRQTGWSYTSTISHYYGDEKPTQPRGRTP